jgi:ubiquinone/menaquinone biosynthesis C-methylase UbiE
VSGHIVEDFVMTRYDEIGKGYNFYRKADHRVLKMVMKLLSLPVGSAVADVGAGTGNYTNELADYGYKMKAIEPSQEMRNQALVNENVVYVDGSAESVPLPDNSVDGVVSTLAIHHFSSIIDAASEMKRICPGGPVVLFTIDPRLGEEFWFSVYFPEIYQRLFTAFSPVGELADLVANVGEWSKSIHRFPMPYDFCDLNMHSGWNRPELYLDPNVRRCMSGFALASKSEVEAGLERLRSDLESGRWDDKFGALRQRSCYDLGFVFLKFKTDSFSNGEESGKNFLQEGPPRFSRF